VNFYLLQTQDQEISLPDFEKVCGALVKGKAVHEEPEAAWPQPKSLSADGILARNKNMVGGSTKHEEKSRSKSNKTLENSTKGGA
jgi:hypothetical protein